MAAIHQTIAIVDRSNKVVSTSKQLKNVFKEAKLAYLERKAEIVAERRAKEDRELRKAMEAVTMAEEDARSQTSRRPGRHHSYGRDHGRDGRRPSPGGQYRSSESVRRDDHAQRTIVSEAPAAFVHAPHGHGGLAQLNEDLYGPHRSAPTSPVNHSGHHDLVRRTTDLPLEHINSHRPPPVRSHSTSEVDDHVDMDLAYGEFHPETLMLDPKVEQQLQKQEMSSLVLKCKLLMDEANCAQHSIRATIAHLQQNPDAMAAIALTLAEISNLATKMAPSALTVFKTGAPAVFAMLAAPEFLIAVGVGVGITVVMFGGYKIIKKIRARSNQKEDAGVDEMIDVHELDRIEHWRRGISDGDTASVATSVEGEFITPMAAVSKGHLPFPRDRQEETYRSSSKEEKSRRKQRLIEDDTDRTLVGSEGSSKTRKSKSAKREKVAVKVKKPSPLRRIFHSRDSETSSKQ
ncbi:hypothetical protein PV11_08464 [Exophiala sideris]|uniref:Uncharacterized protein n=1 Tax=Exophiala sideris TaxID=1016849 RepID=A0A0D1VXI0_9EURO|nr:hypothetical protein PV11_08464 [Exophiala sideris]